MKIDRDIEPSPPQPSSQSQVVGYACHATTACGDDDVVEMRIPTQNREGWWFDNVREVRVRKLPAYGPYDGRRKDDVADQPQPHQKNSHSHPEPNLEPDVEPGTRNPEPGTRNPEPGTGNVHCSMLASSMSITGMSSLMS